MDVLYCFTELADSPLGNSTLTQLTSFRGPHGAVVVCGIIFNYWVAREGGGGGIGASQSPNFLTINATVL